MEILVFCPRCARIQFGKTEDEPKLCPDCNALLVKTDIPKTITALDIYSHEYYELHQKILMN